MGIVRHYTKSMLLDMAYVEQKLGGFCAGFGSRMLAKYGFEGQGTGLGRNSQGRAEPISAVMRPKGLGLGAAGGK